MTVSPLILRQHLEAGIPPEPPYCFVFPHVPPASISDGLLRGASGRSDASLPGLMTGSEKAKSSEGTTSGRPTAGERGEENGAGGGVRSCVGCLQGAEFQCLIPLSSFLSNNRGCYFYIPPSAFWPSFPLKWSVGAFPRRYVPPHRVSLRVEEQHVRKTAAGCHLMFALTDAL